MSQQTKYFSTKSVLTLERGKPGACEKHKFETLYDIEKYWKKTDMEGNNILYSCPNCNLERIYKQVTII